MYWIKTYDGQDISADSTGYWLEKPGAEPWGCFGPYGTIEEAVVCGKKYDEKACKKS